MTYHDFWRGRPVVYRAFDADGRLLYIGATSNLPRRVTEHRSASWWWMLQVVKVRVKLYPTDLAAKAVEKAAIKAELPVFNCVGYGNWREGPYWSDEDRKLYREWYARIIGRSVDPGTRDRLLALIDEKWSS